MKTLMTVAMVIGLLNLNADAFAASKSGKRAKAEYSKSKSGTSKRHVTKKKAPRKTKVKKQIGRAHV